MLEFKKEEFERHISRSVTTLIPLTARLFTINMAKAKEKKDYWDGKLVSFYNHEDVKTKGYSVSLKEYQFLFAWVKEA